MRNGGPCGFTQPHSLFPKHLMFAASLLGTLRPVPGPRSETAGRAPAKCQWNACRSAGQLLCCAAVASHQDGGFEFIVSPTRPRSLFPLSLSLSLSLPFSSYCLWFSRKPNLTLLTMVGATLDTCLACRLSSLQHFRAPRQSTHRRGSRFAGDLGFPFPGFAPAFWQRCLVAGHHYFTQKVLELLFVHELSLSQASMNKMHHFPDGSDRA